MLSNKHTSGRPLVEIRLRFYEKISDISADDDDDDFMSYYVKD